VDAYGGYHRLSKPDRTGGKPLERAAFIRIHATRSNRMRRSRPIEISLAGWFSVRPAGVFAFVSAQNELSGDSRMSSL
jgi:hypothetical protein